MWPHPLPDHQPHSTGGAAAFPSKPDRLRRTALVTLTAQAVAAIQNLTSQNDAPPGSGLRITTDDTRGALQLSLAPNPAQGDAVVESGGARLFLDTNVAAAMGESELDARTEPDGKVLFTLVEPSG